MGTNFAPLLADLFIYSYEEEFILNLLSSKQKYKFTNNSLSPMQVYLRRDGEYLEFTYEN